MTVMMAALLMAGCAGSDDGLQAEKPSPTDVTPVDGKYPIGFTAYAERGITRGGQTGLTDIDALKQTKALGGGFGVFAYYTDLKKYDQTYVPNYMYNQGVFWKGENGTETADAWFYSPVMYWPNESGNDAASDDEDKVSFFAYAPYVASGSAAAGSIDTSADPTAASWGITGFSRNTNAGDPLVKYIANFSTANTVDLCWGVCNEPTWAKIQGGTSQTMAVGKPWIDVEHPQTTAQKMNFTFKHALAQLNVQIDADVDIAGHSGSADPAENPNLDGSTKVYVRSISFTGIAMRGALNLNNTVANQALWLDYSGTTDLPYGESVTVKDGRRDGREGAAGAEATNETPAGLNPEIIQNSTATTGVTTTYQNLFSPSGAIAIPGSPTDEELAARLKEPVYVIPTGEAMTVTIVYDVETANPDLTSYLSDGVTHGSSIENKITKTIYYNGSGLSLESGKKYTLTLHLGMNSMKFNASVDSWDNTVVSGSGWLPENVSAVRIMKGGVQKSKIPVALSDATLALTGDVHPTAADQTLTWVSSNTSIASFADASVGTLTLNGEGECTITATSTATGKSASCDILVTHNYANVVAGDISKIIAADGLVYANTTKAAEYGTNGVGIICYVGAAGSVDNDASAAGYKALALALNDANGGATCQWCDATGTNCLTNQLTDYTNLYVTESAYQTGIGNTTTLTTDGHTHAAATAAASYGVGFDTGFAAANSGWFLPTISQWNMMIKTVAPTSVADVVWPGQTEYNTRLHNNTDIPMWTYTNAGYTAAVINPILTANGGTGLQSYNYWSSTESSATSAWSVAFNHGTVSSNLKTSSRYVRAALAF